MKLTVVAMVKNEIDVIRDCCGHYSALFDDIVIVDHRSTDGTREYLDEISDINNQFHIYGLTEPGYYQSVVMTWVVKNIEYCTQADWVFLLDADEVLPFSSRSEFERYLTDYKSDPIIRLPWKNLVPIDYKGGSIFGRCYLEPNKTAMHQKIAYQPALIPISDFTIAQGNHAILAGNYNKELPSTLAFNLYHIPIRSKEQLGFKIIQGTSSYTAMGKSRDKILGSHWFEISNLINESGITDELMNGLALRYGEPIEKSRININHDKLLKIGCQDLNLSFARNPLPDPVISLDSTEKIIKMLSDFQLSQGYEIKAGEDVSIKLNSNGEIVMMGANVMPKFSILDERDKIDVADSDFEFILKFMLPATWKIESFTPTSWGGHIPFLFCLVTLMRPRVYAELGSHYGASFFAACQAMKQSHVEGKAVAIDMWKGDEHAGYYGESVYKKFQYILNNRYSDVGESLRMSFHDASGLFTDQSIDLLHIDGLHTYEAVKNDYETWRSKITSNGVILFHDTNVYEREFGVWKLWKEISEDNTAFEFKHTHGLGVMAIGSADNNPVVKLLKLVNSNALLAEYFETFFSRIGELTSQESIIEIKEGSSTESTSVFGSMRQKMRVYKHALRNRLVNFIKSVPFLRKTAYSILRIARR